MDNLGLLLLLSRHFLGHAMATLRGPPSSAGATSGLDILRQHATRPRAYMPRASQWDKPSRVTRQQAVDNVKAAPSAG